jgi:hypothetical protein
LLEVGRTETFFSLFLRHVNVPTKSGRQKVEIGGKTEAVVKENSKKRRCKEGELLGTQSADAKSLSPDQALKINGWRI